MFDSSLLGLSDEQKRLNTPNLFHTVQDQAMIVRGEDA